MKKLTPILSIAMLIWACGANETKSAADASKDSAKAMSESMRHIDKDAVDFATAAAYANLREIELGKLAQQHADYQRLKDFGQKMIQMHTQANRDLQHACYSNGVSIPEGLSDGDRKELDELAKKKNKAFDRAYIKKMVSEHQAAMEKLDAAVQNMKDTALQNYARKTLPVVKDHLEEARHILEDVRKSYAPEQFDDVESYQ